MNTRNLYDIAFKGLGPEKSDFGFDMDDRFFGSFESSEIKGGRVHADVSVQKAGTSVILDFVIKGMVIVECDRCLEDCPLPVDYSGRMEVKFTDEQIDARDGYDGEVLWLREGEDKVNVAQYIYESIVLSLPYQRIHPVDDNGNLTCDPDMTGRFKIVSREEFDKLTAPEEQKMADNPEWGKLKELRDKM